MEFIVVRNQNECSYRFFLLENRAKKKLLMNKWNRLKLQNLHHRDKFSMSKYFF